MKTFDLTTFSQEEEINHICDYLTKTWDVPAPETLKQIVSNVFTTGWNASSGRIEYCSKLLDILETRYDISHSLGTTLNEDPLTDLLAHILMTTMRQKHQFDDNLKPYDKRIKLTIQSLKSHFDTKVLSTLLPHNYKAIRKTYKFEEDDLYEKYYNDLEKPSYGGITVKTPGAQDFSYRLAMHNVVYNEVEQGDKPLPTLVGAIYAHGFSLHQLSNEAMLGKSVETLSLADNILQVEDNEVIKTLLNVTLQNNPKFENIHVEYLSKYESSIGEPYDR